MEDRIVRPVEVAQLVGLSGRHSRRLEAAGTCPQRFKICEGSGKFGATGWLLSTIRKYIKKRAATARSTEEVDA